uniref:Glucagon like peptide 2 receptor n=1 Tax=Podarcis muralis TaxID=64176 RepID=A0A670ILJ2_PODMU|nr:glucagon-like peptide 2 receptor [Podarcis muralis]XP_028572911.1 glucagon-like peptide 2 receptor [Podarcis muralis]XP_028572912.1 glucagon-like peptide 2 receptor [Podarcis muralis]
MKLYSGTCPTPVFAITMLFLIKQAEGSYEKIRVNLLNYKEACLKMLHESAISPGIYCNGSFDEFVCWPHSPPGIVSVPCPHYLPWIENGSARNVYRICLDQGIWKKVENSTVVWDNRTECSGESHYQRKDEEQTLWISTLYIYTVGYTFSLVSLVLALFILMLLRKLHCTRNYIHMNLFVAFILRAAGVLIKDRTTHSTYVFLYVDSEKPSDLNGWISFSSPEKLFLCRMAQLLMHYVVGANFFWILVEGIYLHRLLVATVLSEKHLLLRYIFIGWGFPVLFVASWGITKYQLEYEGCWATHHNMAFWWIIRGPILFSIVVNFCIFLKIVKLLLSKLKAQQMSFRDYKFRLARSTLVLIPLLGIHEIVFNFIVDERIDGLSRHIKVFIQLTLGSFQGFFVALLYCFSNGEVKAELRKKWSHFLLASPFVCMPCFLGKNIKHLGRCSKKEHSNNNCFSLEVTQPQSTQVAKQRTGGKAELSFALKHIPRASLSDSSEGEVTMGETTEEVFEESEISICNKSKN